MKENINSYSAYVRLISSGAVATQTNNISYFIQQFWFRHQIYIGLLYITHFIKSNILIHLVNNIGDNNLVLFDYKRKINKFIKNLILI